MKLAVELAPRLVTLEGPSMVGKSQGSPAVVHQGLMAAESATGPTVMKSAVESAPRLVALEGA
ncbi:MAG: hypothetical protein SGPRY_013576, partial [Prymnesium sp.]